MTEWSFYDEKTGSFARQHYNGPEVELNTPLGHKAITGRFDPDSQRVDLMSGEVLDWQPPKPDDEHEWNPQLRRWVRTFVAAERIASQQDAQEKIDGLERAQARALRELALEPANLSAKQRLIEIEAAIVTLRTRLA